MEKIKAEMLKRGYYYIEYPKKDVLIFSKGDRNSEGQLACIAVSETSNVDLVDKTYMEAVANAKLHLSA